MFAAAPVRCGGLGRRRLTSAAGLSCRYPAPDVLSYPAIPELDCLALTGRGAPLISNRKFPGPHVTSLSQTRRPALAMVEGVVRLADQQEVRYNSAQLRKGKMVLPTLEKPSKALIVLLVGSGLGGKIHSSSSICTQSKGRVRPPEHPSTSAAQRLLPIVRGSRHVRDTCRYQCRRLP